MADLTQGTVDGLLGLLTSAIKEEARLLGGVQGDIQFIKDEMDSMNGFLLHLTKTETAHNDQHRAWMKQVRDIAYIARDCIELYMRDLSPPRGTGLSAKIRHLPVLLRTYWTRHRLANQLHELKDRVREVGERRLRYGVSVPETAMFKPEQAVKDIKADEKMEEFKRALEEQDPGANSSPSFSTAISLLPGGLPTEAGKEIGEIITKWPPGHVHSMKMLLRALYAYPHVTKEELTNLKNKLMDGRRAVDVNKEVMILSYSKLSTHYKSCLQYLTAFLEETSISRTSLVRRWLAEGLVARDEGIQMEEAGERCFNELVFRGFVQPAAPVDPGLKIKSCCMEESVRPFVVDIARSENFLAGALPTHLRHQLKIREIAQPRQETPQPQQQQPKQRPMSSQEQQQQPKQRPRSSWNICPRKQQLLDDENVTAAEAEKLHRMDELAQLLKNLPKEYRLNVLDLGGCNALKDHHLKSIIGKVLWLKYLSIRKTNVTRLPKEINNLRRLETLDVRQTRILARDTTHVDLAQLKHLLAGHNHPETDESLITVQMPRKIARSMEILRYVQILQGQAELEQVGSLKQLRKLGVVIQGSQENMKHLHRTINKLSECLRSLSIWITELQDTPAGGATLDGDEGATDDKDVLSSPRPKKLESLNIKLGSSSSGSLPRWIEGLDLLSKITLRDTQLSHKSLRTLGKLENLRCLRLRRGSYTDATINLEQGEFPKLQFLLIEFTSTIKISFQKDAAPKMEKIAWTFDKEIKADTISGINHLVSLQELELNGNGRRNDEWRQHVVRALEAHPKHPRLKNQGQLVPYDSVFEVSITDGNSQ